MPPSTFAEKILGAPAGSIVFRPPDLVLTHDNTASILGTFRRMGGRRVWDPSRCVVALDHNAPPTTVGLSNDYEAIAKFVREQGIARFHRAGEGISHQLMIHHAQPGMLIAGSDSHTSTAGAFNALAVGIDRTEAAGLWFKGESWWRVPESLKISLRGRLPPGVSAKDLALWIIGRIGSAGATYLSVEFHGDVAGLSLDDRMVLCNLAAEMGAKNAVFPCDAVLRAAVPGSSPGIWADPAARYAAELTVELGDLFPVAACPHTVDNVRAVAEIAGVKVRQALIGTCTNGRLEDLRAAAAALRGRQVHPDVQMLVIPASREVYVQAAREGLVLTFLEAGAQVLSASCGPCPGTGQGIPADGWTVISTANRNFRGRMGNPNASIYLASPATVAASAVAGEIVTADAPGSGPARRGGPWRYPYRVPQSATSEIPPGEDRLLGNVWNYSDVDNLSTDHMFAGSEVYRVKSSEPALVVPHLFRGLDPSFAARVAPSQVILAGLNLGAGSSRDHPAVGLAHAGVKAVICKSAARIFFRSAINQGLAVIICPEAVAAYRPGDPVEVAWEQGRITVGASPFAIPALPEKLQAILRAGGLMKLYQRAG
jgi:3-isopropylmalate dehydratase large subunit/3-isopropylmalate dehydratase small subunit